MFTRIIVGSFVGAIILLFWGFIFWKGVSVMIAPWTSIKRDGDTDVIATLKQTFPTSGVYVYPWVDVSKGDKPGLEEEFNRQLAEGPFVQVVYYSDGSTPSEMGKMIGFGFLHMWASAVVCSVLLAMAAPSSYRARIGFVFVLGIFATLWTDVADIIWWHFPVSHVLFTGTYDVIAWLLASIGIAAIVKKPNGAIAEPAT